MWHVSNMQIITGRNPRGPHEHCTKKRRVRRWRHKVVPVSSSVRRHEAVLSRDNSFHPHVFKFENIVPLVMMVKFYSFFPQISFFFFFCRTERKPVNWFSFSKVTPYRDMGCFLTIVTVAVVKMLRAGWKGEWLVRWNGSAWVQKVMHDSVYECWNKLRKCTKMSWRYFILEHLNTKWEPNFLQSVNVSQWYKYSPVQLCNLTHLHIN